MHTMKCIGLFKGLHSSTCVINMYGNTQFRYTISIENALRFNLVLLKFQNFPLSTLSRHTVVCRAAQEAGVQPREYIDRKKENAIFAPP